MFGTAKKSSVVETANRYESPQRNGAAGVLQNAASCQKPGPGDGKTGGRRFENRGSLFEHRGKRHSIRILVAKCRLRRSLIRGNTLLLPENKPMPHPSSGPYCCLASNSEAGYKIDIQYKRVADHSQSINKFIASSVPAECPRAQHAMHVRSAKPPARMPITSPVRSDDQRDVVIPNLDLVEHNPKQINDLGPQMEASQTNLPKERGKNEME